MYRNRCKRILQEYEDPKRHFNLKDLKKLNEYETFKDLMSVDVFKEIIRSKKRRKNKRSRTKRQFREIQSLQFILGGKIVFGTATLNNESLDLKIETRRKKLNAWIKNHFVKAIINEDYGKEKGRFHFHFIALCTERLEKKKNAAGELKRTKKGYPIQELTKKDYEMGHEPTLLVVEDDDEQKLVNYLLKLNNHSNKETTRSRVRVLEQNKVKILRELEYI